MKNQLREVLTLKKIRCKKTFLMVKILKELLGTRLRENKSDSVLN